MKKLKYGMVGGGKDAFIGEVHRKAMAMDSQFELVAGALSSTAKKSIESGKDLGLSDNRNYPDWQTMLNSELALPKEEQIDFVVIVTPNHLHYPVAKAFAKAGFNIVCDKPLVHTLEQAKELKKIVKEQNIVFAVSHNYTGYPMVKQARHMVKTGKLGKIRKIVIEYNQGWLASDLAATGQKQASWRADPAKSGMAGALGDIGSHAENLMSTIAALEIKEICADLTSFVEGRLLDDDASILMRLESNAKAVLMASQIAVGEENNLKISIFAEKASLIWQQEDPNYLVYKTMSEAMQVLKRGNDYLCEEAKAASRLPSGHPEGFIEAFANLYLEFGKAVRAKQAGQVFSNFDFPNINDGLRGIKFIEKTLESASSEQKWTEF